MPTASDLPRHALVVPTLNAGPDWPAWLDTVRRHAEGVRVLVVDSCSDDDTAAHTRAAGLELRTVPRASFNHGGTRQLAAQWLDDVEVVVFLTQDALLADAAAVSQLVASFRDPRIAAAYGRQLPHRGAGAIEAHARLFNYPARSHRVAATGAEKWGIKAPFLSNSFAAYRREALLAVGGFPDHVIVSEDMYIGAKLLLAGWDLAYVAEAAVHHSHGYGLLREFRRYFDIGVFHAREAWIREAFGGAGGEGWRFVRSELRYLLRTAPWRIPETGLRTVLKFAGFHAGLAEARLPPRLKPLLSQQRYWWDASARSASA